MVRVSLVLLLALSACSAPPADAGSDSGEGGDDGEGDDSSHEDGSDSAPVCGYEVAAQQVRIAGDVQQRSAGLRIPSRSLRQEVSNLMLIY